MPAPETSFAVDLYVELQLELSEHTGTYFRVAFAIIAGSIDNDASAEDGPIEHVTTFSLFLLN